MDLQALVDGVLRGEVRPVWAPTEADYHAVWLEHGVGVLDPYMMAVLGGALADRLAWVFVAGYQGTIRRCFPDLPQERGWSSFVNTEDRSGSLPGTSLSGEPSNRRLSGWKTWVATSDHVERLLVSARQGETPFVVVRRDQPGVRIETGEPRAYLSEMTQGRVEFTDVLVGEDQLVGDERTFPVFRSAEAAYVRAALNAFIYSQACRLGGGPALIGQALAGVHAAASILQLPLPSHAAAVAIFGFDIRTTALAQDFATFIETEDTSLHGLWMKDRRLITGAANGIATRAVEALDDMAQG
jgi:alkylation response protein AidB-like acyl-CoA dehydrogenase